MFSTKLILLFYHNFHNNKLLKIPQIFTHILDRENAGLSQILIHALTIVELNIKF